MKNILIAITLLTASLSAFDTVRQNTWNDVSYEAQNERYKAGPKSHMGQTHYNGYNENTYGNSDVYMGY